MDSKKKQQLIDFGKGWVERNTISVEVNEDRGNYRVGINWGDDYYGTEPSTKEERDLLFAKMKEAGYEWDAEKKELKKIEQRISDNIPQSFEKYVEHLLSLSDGEGHGSPAKVKEVSAELFKLAKLKQKHAWSEEDEKMYKIALSCIETLEDITNGKNMHADVKDWLKSIKDRIGG